jgi:hypothetical protein
MSDKKGFFKGEHYSNYPDRIKELKKAGKYNEAESLLLEMVEAVEAESKKMNYGVAPWYYEQLAIIYNKMKLRDKEIEILERFSKQKMRLVLCRQNCWKD